MADEQGWQSQYAKPGPYKTQLAPQEESQFQQWVKQNNVPWQDTPTADYDMRGYWRAMASGKAKQSLNANDKTMHFPDTYKTPYHKSFSNESMYALPNAPKWNEQDQLVDSKGHVVFDERATNQPQQPPEQQFTLEQFGQSIKDKYPQYASMSNVDIANKVIAKYPQYKDHIKPSTGAPGSTGTPTAPGNPTHTMQAAPPFFSVAGMKEHGYRAARAVLDLLPTAGGVAGGMIGAAGGVETGPGAVATAAGGAALGGSAGEAAKQLGEHLIFHDGPNTAVESAKDIAKEGAIQGVNELTGQLAGKAIAPALKYFGDTATASKDAAVSLLPSEARGKAPSYLEKYMKGSVITSGKMERFRVMQNAQTTAAAQKVADNISTFRGTPEELGQMVQKGIDDHTTAFRIQQNKMYSDIDNAVAEKVVQKPVQKTEGAGFMQQTKTVMQNSLEGPAMPSTKPLKDFARAELKKLDEQEKIMDPALLSSSRAMLQNVLNAPDRVTFKAMASSRSDMLALTRKLDEALPGKQAGFAKKLAGIADQSMIDAAEKSGIPGLPEDIRAANAYTANEHAMFEQALVKKVVDTKKPEEIAKLIRGKAVGLEETRNLFTILPKELHPAVQRQVLVDTMAQATNTLTKNFNERKFAETIAGMGDERGKVIFGDNWKNIRELSKLMERINGPVGLMGGGSGASLQNAKYVHGVFSGLGAGIPAVLFSTGQHAAAATALGAEAVGFLGATVGYRTMAEAMTNPESAVKLLKVARAALKGVPYTATGGFEVGKGQTKATRDLKAIRDKHAAQMQPTQ